MANESNVVEVVFKEISTKNGLFCQFDEHHGVLLLDVKSPFTADDFRTIETIIDPYFVANGELMGVIVHSKKFPYWSSAQNRAEYIHFAQDNHHKFKKAAFSMGGFFAKIVVRIGRSRAHPEMKIFKYNQIEKAQDWVLMERKYR